jgi:hypothetical protein
MTLPASGPISLSQVNTELLITPSTTLITMNDSGVRFLTGTSAGTTDSMSQLLGKSYVIAANSGILTGSGSYTLPQTSGTTIKILAIGGGGGGGGGSGRTSYSGYFTGGAGGGAGGNALYTLTVTPGTSNILSYSCGGAGYGGNYKDGRYDDAPPPWDGGAGGTTTVTFGGTVAQSTGGGGGGRTDYSPGPAGTAGSASVGTQQITATAGSQAADGATTGGTGAQGYAINTTVGLSIGSILTYGSSGNGGGAQNSGQRSSSGTVYGAGGGGGGCSQSDVYNYVNMFSSAGTQGAVFIWWGY